MDECSFELQNIKKKCNIYTANTTSLVYSLIIMVVLMYVQKFFFSIFQYSFLQKVQLNSLALKCELDIVTHFYSTGYEKKKIVTLQERNMACIT